MKAEQISRYFVERPTLFWSFVVGILVAGVFSFMQMPKLEDPAVCGKQAMVVAMYPGASAHQVELKVAQKLEDQLRTLPDVHEIRTECQSGVAMITIEFEMTVLNEKLEEHFDLLRRKVGDVKGQLPSGCYDPVVVDDMMDVYGIFYSLTGDGYTYPEMEKYAKLIRRELLKVKGVKRVNIACARSEVINITLSKEKLARNGIIPTQLMMQLQTVGQEVNAGKYETDGNRIQLRVNNRLDTADDIREMLIKTMDGKVMRLGDLATVERTFAEPQTNGFFVDGKPALAICVTMNTDAIVPDVGKAVDQQLAQTMKRLPAGLSTDKIFFQPDKVNEAINGFMINLLESVLIVVIVLIFSMGWRSGMIIGMGLVLTIAVSFPILLSMGSTLQRISLGAFIIAMGMLVDNSIVIMDGILVDKKRGLPRPQYLYNICNHTALPLLGATVIAAGTFVSVYLSPDTAGEYCRDMFLVLCVSLLASWVLALIQVPACANAWMSEPENADSELHENRAHQMVRKTLNVLIGHKTVTIIAAVALLAVSGLGALKVKNLFFPDFDYKQFVVEYQLPDQTSPDRVQHDLLEITDSMLQDKRIERVAAVMGTAPAHYCLVRPMTNGGESYGELMVDCPDFETVQEVIPEWRRRLRQAYPDAHIRFRKYNFSVSTSHTVEVVFKGPDPAVLKQLSAQAEKKMRECKYVDAYSVSNNWKTKGKALVADYVKTNALRAGISRSNVADALMAATDGLPVGVINDQDKTVVVNMLVRQEDGSRIQNLHDIPVWGNVNLNPNDLAGLMTGATDAEQLKEDMFRTVPMSSVTDSIRLDWEEDFVYRVNGERTIEAQCDPNTELFQGTTAKVEQELKSAIAAIPLPAGYSMDWGGETKLQRESTANVLKYVPLTLFLILTLLLLLFNNWKEVFLVLICFPFVICGIIPSLLLFRQPFTFMAIIGLMGLMGMMVKNGIVLVDEINRLNKEEHYSAYDSVITATISRVRPVLMASLTTILGMAPLLGDPMYGSMAVCIMAGLTVGTIITLILLPVIYSVLFHVKKPQEA
ncbi:efflux RND transporter permease subunit [Prevotella copri]|uniref:Efflux RND transporter permease subunit n=1 Tax=Segatella copri TaxID=165179 RepID=A0A6G1U1M4_9BACT|nr:efflux RND transporter permease subunit [Segatella copri]MQN81055.1 efflux RND transporter permease subunit [Segatella copri]